MRSEYAWVPPHPEVAEAATTTHPHQVGVAFSGHRRLVYESRDRTATADVAPGSTVVSAASAITWLRVHELTEALEIYPDPDLVRPSPPCGRRGRSTSTGRRPSGRHRPRHRVGPPAGPRVRRGAGRRRGERPRPPARRPPAHQVRRRPAPARAAPGLLDARTVDDVADLVEARLGGPLTLDDLAAVAHLSPFHFARAFARTTGLAPHRFVTARRMDRARRLL